jgi:leucyl-tRNA synthetase
LFSLAYSLAHLKFIQKRMSEIGADAAFRRTLLFSEPEILRELMPYLKKSLSLEDVEVFFVEEALQREGPGFTRTIIESSEPGGPAFEYRNV